jgi:hypothetical protein
MLTKMLRISLGGNSKTARRLRAAPPPPTLPLKERARARAVQAVICTASLAKDHAKMTKSTLVGTRP